MDDPTFNSFSPLGNTSRVVDLRNQAPKSRIPKFFDQIPRTVVCKTPSEVADVYIKPQNTEFVDEKEINEQLSSKNQDAADIVW